MEIEELLKERRKTHGDFAMNAITAKSLFDIVISDSRGNEMQSSAWLALNVICQKIARICQTPDEVDHWKDIAGYATLVVKDLEK